MSVSRFIHEENRLLSVRKLIRLPTLPNDPLDFRPITTPFKGEPDPFYLCPRPLPHPRIHVHVNPIHPISIRRLPPPSSPYPPSHTSTSTIPTSLIRLTIIRARLLPRSEDHELEQDDHEGEERQPDYSYDQDDGRIKDGELIDPWFRTVLVRAVGR